MNRPVNEILNEIYEAMVRDGMLHFPPQRIIDAWECVLNEWIAVSQLPLFLRQPSKIRGSDIKHVSGRPIIITDNTPAHWVYTKLVFDNKPINLDFIAEGMTNRSLPLAMMRKKIECDDLHKTQVATKEFRLGNKDWKLAHIKGVAIPRSLNLPLEAHQQHHHRFLSLNNIYLIRKEYSGLAEVKSFNEIIMAKRTS